MRPSKRLIPMLAIAAVLLNVDAAFACSTKSKAYLSAMKSDLRNLVSAEEAFYADSNRNSTSLEELEFKPSTGVVAPVIRITPGGYAATATHTLLPTMTCNLYVGPKPTNWSNIGKHGEGEVWCEGEMPAQAGRVDAGIAISGLVLLLALTLASTIFLGPMLPKSKNWPARGLFFVSLLYLLAMAGPSFCSGPAPAPLAIFASIGIGLFWFAFRRRVGPA